MTTRSRLRRALAAGAVISLGACGSGGSTDPGSGGDVAAPPPTSGTYAWLLKAEGSTASTGVDRRGLSLLHPQQREVEVVIEPLSSYITAAKVVSSATVDPTLLRTSDLDPYALVYIVGGDLRRVPLRANGQPPASRVQRAQTTSACRFLVDAIDYVQPEQSRFIVSTAGPDGRCDSDEQKSADDVSAEVRLDANLGLVLTTLAGSSPIAALRDPVTLAPRGWLTTTSMHLWSAGGTETITVRPAADPLTRALAATHRSVLAESASGLTVIDIGAGSSFTETPLTTLAGTGWESLGFDARHYFVYRNAGTTTAPSWSVVRIDRASKSAATLASGTGQIVLSSMGVDVLYLTVVDTATIELRRLLKAVPGSSQVVQQGPSGDSFFTVFAGATGAHMRWQATGLAGPTPAYRIDIIDDAGLTLYTGPGGFSLGPADAGRIDFATSENRTRFLFVENFGERLFADTTLVAFDGDRRAATRIGRLPGVPEFGTDSVYANAIAGPAPFYAGFASRTVGGVIQAAGTRVFTFDPGVAGDLRFVSTTR